jgi:hypothetical protein
MAATVSKKYTGDPAFREEMRQIAADHADQPLTAEERAKIATPIMAGPRPKIHEHKENCWEEPYKATIPSPRGKGKVGPAFITVMVQRCRFGGSLREVKE